MKTLELGNSKILNLLFKPAGLLMGSKLRKRLMDPYATLAAAQVLPGQNILEVGCGTGFFTIPAAKLVGKEGRIIALDASSSFLKEVSLKVKRSGLKNVCIIQRDAISTKLEESVVDKVLLFGVIPFPLLPLAKLLPEMHRVLKPDSNISVWLFPPLVHNWVPKAINQSGLFSQINRVGNVYNFKKI